MIQRIDLSKQDLERYPQYYRDKYFVSCPEGRFIRWNDIPKNIQDMLMKDIDATNTRPTPSNTIQE